MTVAIVGTPKTATTATLNPSAAMGNVTAGHTLATFVIQQSGTYPGTPTDTRGDLFTPFGGTDLSQAATGVAMAALMCDSPRAAGGNTTITLPTAAACAFVATELSGVAAPGTIVTPKGTAGDPNTLPFFSSIPLFGQRECPIAIGTGAPNGGLCIALIAHLGTVTYTFNASGWTHAGFGSALGMTWDAWLISLPVAGEATADWTVDRSANGLVIGACFPSA